MSFIEKLDALNNEINRHFLVPEYVTAPESGRAGMTQAFR